MGGGPTADSCSCAKGSPHRIFSSPSRRPVTRVCGGGEASTSPASNSAAVSVVAFQVFFLQQERLRLAVAAWISSRCIGEVRMQCWTVPQWRVGPFWTDSIGRCHRCTGSGDSRHVHRNSPGIGIRGSCLGLVVKCDGTFAYPTCCWKQFGSGVGVGGIAFFHNLFIVSPVPSVTAHFDPRHRIHSRARPQGQHQALCMPPPIGFRPQSRPC
mmetsp:Transcript_24181/g.55172  ORF Transcript_24181/g.55172 Transcript_24181/m.55172 type:complete len:212 (+) Transcript_24181:626-1261(+)